MDTLDPKTQVLELLARRAAEWQRAQLAPWAALRRVEDELREEWGLPARQEWP